MLRILAVVVLVGACGAPDMIDSDSRFIGHWFVEETEAHALYSASTYELAMDGSVALAWNADLYPRPHGYVLSPDQSNACLFGATWHEGGDDVLVIDGDCDDGRRRQIVLAFRSDPSQNAAGADVEIVTVGGEEGWLPPAFGWSFQKCPAGEICIGWEL